MPIKEFERQSKGPSQHDSFFFFSAYPTTITFIPRAKKMRRGFLNHPRAKSGPKRSHDGVPPTQPSLSPSVNVTNTRSNPPIDNYSNALCSDDDVKQWAHKLGETPKTLYNRMGTQMARMNDTDFKMVFRNVTFKDFQGVVFADVKIHDLIPRRFDSRPSALENAYRIAPAAGKGSGMFANRDIPAGAAILVENPIVVFPGVMGLGMSMSKDDIFKMLFDRLDPGVRERALSLWNCKPADICGKEEGIVRTNGFGLELAAPKIAVNPLATRYSGTFLDLSRCNHSCGPNATHTWDPDTFSTTLHATCNIKEGDEITIEYTKLTESRQTRRGRLFDMYLFHCECEYCNLPDDEARASDEARSELTKWSERSFSERCQNLSLHDGKLVNGFTRCIQLHEQESIFDMSFALHVSELALVYGMLADAKNFELWGRKAVESLRIMRALDVPLWEEWLANPQQNFKNWGKMRHCTHKARR
ncbi:hypothetical protein PILCRDRAFT_503834 [Piloderma croceum F 1598]|uniref:SET domain-containing protein n=1 Tax=Piloderma croceum (strain F 1598) TaxID=765440 RepID=A0A0C3F976_PILCF|nr:hypothetical protein PILCRDRAFT_503834 [Piloderma croceum F 1598]